MHTPKNGILITGGTGFLARGLVRALLARGDERVCIYSRGEYPQALMRRDLKDDERLRWFIGDIRDKERLERAMESVEHVIHAAALKRIEVGHYNPDEMMKTNVIGTMNVIESARRAGVAKVVLVSSDKAFEPASAYGYSKALAESLVLAANTISPWGPRFAVVRYGNVAGSTGSVIPTWREMLARPDNTAKGVPVTDPECTRFWMSRDDAVELVLSTLARMQGGELQIPTLPAYRLHDLAVALGAQTIEVRGLGPWEKKHESMAPGNSSEHARRLSLEELGELLEGVPA